MSNKSLSTKPKQKYRKQLNKEQLAVLELLCKFRFASSEQIAKYSNKKSSKYVQKRLKILEDQELIAKRYDKSYKLKGKPAAYYLLPKGARQLAKLGEREDDEPINTKTIYKDKTVSENFIAHCLNILSSYLQLKAIHGTKLQFYTKSDLNYEHYDYFPQPLPDAYVRLKKSQGEKQFYLDIFEDDKPYFVLVRRTKKYVNYASSGEWATTETELPAFLMVAPNTSVEKRIRKKIARELRESWDDDLEFATTTIPDLLRCGEVKGKVWLSIDEDGDDPEEPVQPKTLSAID